MFLRGETYDSFLSFPHADLWDRVESVNIQQELEQLVGIESSCSSRGNEENNVFVNIDYKIYCSDPSLQKSYIWGSYTNGSGMYKRNSLIEVGRCVIALPAVAASHSVLDLQLKCLESFQNVWRARRPVP